MCDAKTMGMASLGTQALGGIMGATGAYQQSSAQKATLAVNAAISRQNAQIAQQQSDIALQNGQTAEQNARLRTAQTFGGQRAALAANGVDLGEGNANEVLTTTAFMGERDALTIRDNAARQAWAYQVQGANAMANAGLKQAASDSVNPLLAGATSLLGSATAVSSRWYNMIKQGL